MQPHFLPTIGARLMGWCWINKFYSIQSYDAFGATVNLTGVLQSTELSRAIHVGTKGNNVRGMRLCVYSAGRSPTVCTH